MKKIIRFFDRIEDQFRAKLSRHPIIYSLIGSVGIVLLWRGIWLTADMFPFMSGPVSVIAGATILLFIGLLVSFFVGDQILISGLKEEKRIDEKTKEEIGIEAGLLKQIELDIKEIKNRLNNKNGK